MRAQPVDKKARLESAAEQGSQVITMPCESEDDAAAMEGVLSFLYTHALPEAATSSMLHKMAVTADYLGNELCVRACAARMTTLPVYQRCMWQFNDLLNILTTSAANNSALINRVHLALPECLLSSYGDVVSIVTDKNNLRSFMNLPLVAVEAWGSSDKLKHDSENSIVVLLNSWWRHQPEDKQTEDCKKRLSGLVRLHQLSLFYLQYVPNLLDWFTVPANHRVASALIQSYQGYARSLPAEVVNKQHLSRRTGRGVHETLELRWRIPMEAMSNLGMCRLEGPEGYWQGHTWSLYLEKTSDGEGSGIAIRLGVHKKEEISMPYGIPAAVDIEILFPQRHADDMKCTLIFSETSSRHLLRWSVKGPTAAAAMQPYCATDRNVYINAAVDNVQ